jgi:phage-related minor tail protein
MTEKEMEMKVEPEVSGADAGSPEASAPAEGSWERRARELHEALLRDLEGQRGLREWCEAQAERDARKLELYEREFGRAESHRYRVEEALEGQAEALNRQAAALEKISSVLERVADALERLKLTLAGR